MASLSLRATPHVVLRSGILLMAVALLLSAVGTRAGSSDANVNITVATAYVRWGAAAACARADVLLYSGAGVGAADNERGGGARLLCVAPIGNASLHGSGG